MSQQKTAVILTHGQSDGACHLGRIIERRAIAVQTLNVARMPEFELDALEADLLVIMGGPVGVYQADDYPFIKKEITIAKARMAADKPIIGICLGAQIMATALGKEVYKGAPGMEIGWNKIDITEAGMRSPARHFADKGGVMFHWHGDTFDLPDGAELWASSKAYKNQIYQVGDNALGVQCHPEISAERMKDWEVRGVSFVTGPEAQLPLAQWRADTEKYIKDLNEASSLFFNEWLEARGL